MTTRKLDRLNATNSSGLAFQRLWQKNCELTEANFDDLQSQQNDLSSVVSDLAAAVAAITAAQATADAVTANDKLTSSVIVPADVLTASDAGSNATITVASHARRYGDASQISVTGGTVTGLAYSTDYGVYYDDTSLSATAPTYHATTTLSNALNNFVAGRHFLGIVTTPASGGAATTGGSVPAGTDPTFHNRFDT